jgi:hypothetical protein
MVICQNVLKGSCAPNMTRFQRCKHGVPHEERTVYLNPSVPEQPCTDYGYCDMTCRCICVPVEEAESC